jgi:predicted DNA-binding transcriptional regulator AlpA
MLKEFRGDILDVPTLSHLLGISRMTIFRYRKLKDPLPSHKARGKVFFFKADVERWLRERA